MYGYTYEDRTSHHRPAPYHGFADPRRLMVEGRPPGAWYCPDCHALHVRGDVCPDTGRSREDR